MMLDVLEGPRRGRLEFHDFSPELGDFRTALIRGLTARSKSIPCRFLYDARGSALFDRICDLPEYYPTRTELGILEACAAGPARSAISAAQASRMPSSVRVG